MAVTEQQLTRADFDRCRWEDVIAGAPTKECFAYSSLFYRRLQLAQDAGDDAAAGVFAVLGVITHVALREQDDQPFAPRFTGRTLRGAGPDDLTPGQYQILGQLAPDIADAEMRARVCDLLWVMCRDYRLARVAVDAYLDSARVWEHPRNWVQCVDRVTRAVRLARSLNVGGAAEFARAIGYVEEVLARHDGEDPLFMSARLMELLLEFKQGDPRRYAPLAEKAARRAEAEGGPALERAELYWQLAAAWFASAGDRTEWERAMIGAAETHVKWGEEAARKPRENIPHIMAASHLQTAYHALLKVGTPAARSRAAVVYRRLVEVQGRSVSELMSVSHPVDLSDPAKAAADCVAGKPLLQALVHLAMLATPMRVTRLRERVREQLDDPLLGMFSTTTLGPTGKVVATRPHFESSPDGAERAVTAEMHRTAVNHHRLLAVGAILPAIHKITSEHHVREQDFHRLVSNSVFVPRGREMTFTKGLYAGFTGDLIVAVHLLIPQIEQAIRSHLEARGVITSGFDHQNRQNEYDLNRTLLMPELAQIYDEDTIFALRCVLVEHHGSNLRNMMAHGLLSDGELYSDVSLFLWAFVLRLCLTTPPPPLQGEDAGGGGGEQAAASVSKK